MKKSLLLVGLLALGATTYAKAGDFYFTNEVMHRDETPYTSNDVKYEWTIAKGHYGITDDIRFNFDVDRDYNTVEATQATSQGWDTNYSLQKTLGTKEFFGREFDTDVYFDFYWDRTTLKVERRTGLRYSAATKFDNGGRLRTTLWGRYIETTQNQSKTKPWLDARGDHENDVYGLEFNYSQKLTPTWRTSISVAGTYGGFDTEAGSTFNDYDIEGKPMDGFNYWAVFVFENLTPLYKTDVANVGWKTTLLSEWYGQGEEHKDRTTNYERNSVRTGLAAEYKINDTFSVHGEARYSIFGARKNGDGTTSDYNRFDAIAGFKFKL